MFVGPTPTSKDPQPKINDDFIRQNVKEKVQRVLDYGYIELRDIEEVESLMYFFHVPKGKDDIRMVYDGSKSKLNSSIYSPWFDLPSCDSMTRWVLVSSWLADNDYEDCWLNFPLHPDLQKYCGIDIGVLFPELKRFDAQMLIAVWIRNAMGLSNSPYNSIQSALYAKRLVMGDRKNEENPFHWDRIEENLPFSAEYKASLPKLTKVRVDGGHGSEVVVYVDDVRIVACSEDLAWKSSSEIAKGLC